MSDDRDIRPDVLRQRRNLMLASAGSLIFVIGGGEIRAASSPLGLISLEHEWVLVAAIYLFFCYSLWRYWLYVSDDRGEFKGEYRRVLLRMQKYRQYLERVLGTKTEQDRAGQNLAPRYDRGLIKYTLRFGSQIREDGEYIMHKGKGNVEVPAYRMIGFELRALRTVALRHRRFSDLILPYVFAAIAGVALLIDLAGRICGW